MDPNEDHDEHNYILKHPEEYNNIMIYIVVTQKHYNVQNVEPNFQVKFGGSQDTWHKTIGHSPTATRGQETL